MVAVTSADLCCFASFAWACTCARKHKCSRQQKPARPECIVFDRWTARVPVLMADVCEQKRCLVKVEYFSVSVLAPEAAGRRRPTALLFCPPVLFDNLSSLFHPSFFSILLLSVPPISLSIPPLCPSLFLSSPPPHTSAAWFLSSLFLNPTICP